MSVSANLKRHLLKAALSRFSLLVLALIGTGMVVLMAAEKSSETLRQDVEKLQADGNYRDAYQGYEKLVLDTKNSGATLQGDLAHAVNCLRHLQRQSEIDGLLQRAIEAHPNDWQVYTKAAELLNQSEHYGVIVTGEFSRGSQRGGGAFVDVQERDHAQALIWMNVARQKLPIDLGGAEKSLFYRDYAGFFLHNGTGAWRLQDLTDLETLPDYPEASPGRGRFRGWNPESRSQGAPVDEQGNPVFIKVPESFETARTDGERWRWCLRQMVEFDPARKAEARSTFAAFLHSQFGVQTLQQWGIFLPRDAENEGLPEAGTWSLPGLKEDETIARLANGVKRFPLPDEFNFIKIYHELAAGESPVERSVQQNALGQLTQIFLNRQQYPKSVQFLQESLKRFPDHPESRQSQLDQIVQPWGRFEPVMSTAAGSGATVDLRFRNAMSVAFEAHRIKIPELLSDIQKYLESRPDQLDWEKLQIDNIGYQLVTKNEVKYLGEKVADWSLGLEPRPDHFDRRITVTTPLQKAGAYLVKAQMGNGNTTRIVMLLNDTAIVKKPLSDQVMYYMADAVTGAPVDHAHVQFFGWRQEYQQKTKKHVIQTAKFAEFTNPDGLVLVDKKLANENFQWLATVQDGQGRFAYLGFSGIWFSEFQDQQYDEVKAYIVTDRPVYRPDQKVQFKFWIREAKYDLKQSSRFARQKFRVKINDPQGTEVFSQEFETDEFGGLAGEYALPKQAALGAYQIFLDPQDQHAPRSRKIVARWPVQGSNQFRVEEYKKPEFEVTIDSPEKPVSLGEKVTATIRAKYYYGAPVTQARVKFKVERSAHDTRWFPHDPWDWLYGNGYWWFSPDYSWYPGFRQWGCFAPRPTWIHWNPDPPELVLDQEVEIGADGTVQVEIDTALAKALHGDADHEYSITAEVTDASRRTIVGSGKVLVSRAPFKIFAWTNRGHYNVGDQVEARFQARSLDGQGITGPGQLQLLKITYENGKPIETLARQWDLSTNADGFAQQTLTASEPGQYRLSFKMPSQQPDGKPGPEIEGGYLFLVRGQGFDGSQFEFNDLELIADQQHYAPGDKVRLMVNTNQTGSTVLLFVRPANGIAKTAPQVLHLTGKSTLVEIDVVTADMPNFFIEAITVSQGKLHDQMQEIIVPPTERILNVDVIPSAENYLPGAKAEIEVKVTDPEGQPVVGAVLLSVYDRAVEYISGGSNVADIREFFWKWRRTHSPNSESNLQRWFSQLLARNEAGMQNLGVFGEEVADKNEADAVQKSVPMAGVPVRRGMMRGMGGGGHIEMDAMPMAAPMSLAASGAMEKQAAFAVGEGEMVAPTVRTNFADTAFWKADLITDSAGIAKVTFDMPENLSSWKIRAWGMGNGTDVGEATREVVTAKNLVVRLQAPRFFVETDEVVLSAVVHNYLKTEKNVQVQLQLDGETLKLMDGSRQPASTTTIIPANDEYRVDWRVKAVQPGTATVTMKALTDEESDAMQMSFPVIVHGILKTESFSGVIRPDAEQGTIQFTVPEDRQPGQSRIELRYSPTLAGAMVDALPYLADYPYGCTEQTLNRFLPTVITQRILQNMGLDLKAIQDKRTNLNAQEIGDPVERAKEWKRFDRNPVFDADEVASMVKTGVKDLAAMQNPDGGWGWFSGFQERSYPHTTAVVVHGLQLTVKNDVALPEGLLENGAAWLKRYQSEQAALLQEGERHETDNSRAAKYKLTCDDLDALAFSVLVDARITDPEMQRFLYRDRNKVSLYSQALLGLALHEIGATGQRDMVIRNIDQFLKTDAENQTAYLDLPNHSRTWWYWYGNSLEANAQYLKLLTRVNVHDPKAAGLVKYLVNNRKHGTYWNSTRDTAYCIQALAEYLVASGEGQPNMSVEVWLDGELRQTVNITPDVLFTFNNGFVLEGEAIKSGPHTLELRRKSLSPDPKAASPLYFNAYVTNFTTEEFITATGLEIKVGRKFYKLVQDQDATKAVAGDRGQVIDQSVLKYRRQELKSLGEATSGDLIEIELEIDAKNDYEYVIFEDMKAAGCEPVDLQSGYTKGGLGAYVEFRDEKVAFFLRQLARGKHSVSYRVRAETPGHFSALPTQARAMYAPELRANADEMKLQIDDLPEPVKAE